MKRGRAIRSTEAVPIRAADGLAAAGVFTGALLLYALTVCRTVYTGDAGEVAAGAWLFGVVHPPGYPLYTMLSGALMRLFPFGEPALRANALSSLYGAAAVGAAYLSCRTLGAGRFASMAAAAALATGRNFWSQAVQAEVYTLDVLLLLLAFMAGWRAMGTNALWRVVLFGIAVGLSCGHRTVNVLYWFPLVAWVLFRARLPEGRGRALWGFVAGGGSTALLFLYLPLASARDPALDTLNPETLTGFFEAVTAKAYQQFVGGASAELIWKRTLATLGQLPLQTGVGLAAAALGGYLLFREGGSRRGLALFLCYVFAASLAFIGAYNIIDNEGYTNPTVLALTLLAGVGFQGAVDRLPLPALTGALLAGLGWLGVAWNYSANDLSLVREVREYGEHLLDLPEAKGVLIALGDTAYGTSAYLQGVERRRPEVAVLVPPMLLSWHTDDLKRRAPESTIPAYREGLDRAEWMGGLVLSQLERGGIYTTESPEQTLRPFLYPEIYQSLTWMPWGVLFRVFPAAERLSPERWLARMTAANEDFWYSARIPEPKTGREDPQLDSLPVLYASARVTLAMEYLHLGRADLARPHLAAVAASGVDASAERLFLASANTGKAIPRLTLGRRSRAALGELDRGAPPEAVLLGLSLPIEAL